MLKCWQDSLTKQKGLCKTLSQYFKFVLRHLDLFFTLESYFNPPYLTYSCDYQFNCPIFKCGLLIKSDSSLELRYSSSLWVHLNRKFLCALLSPRAKATLWTSEYLCQEQRTGNRDKNLWAVQESNCPVLAFITCWDKDHVERRGARPAEPRWHRGAGAGIQELLPRWHRWPSSRSSR